MTGPLIHATAGLPTTGWVTIQTPDYDGATNGARLRLIRIGPHVQGLLDAGTARATPTIDIPDGFRIMQPRWNYGAGWFVGGTSSQTAKNIGFYELVNNGHRVRIMTDGGGVLDWLTTNPWPAAYPPL